jgi:hypothetical protein
MPRPTLCDHPQFRRLAHLLGMPEPHVLGHLEFLWRVGRRVVGDETDIELAAAWRGERGALCRALLDCQFVEAVAGGRYQIVCTFDDTPAPTTSEPPLLTYPCRGTPKTWHLTAAYVSQLAADYPGIDVLGECRRARAWCQATGGKTARGMPRFLVGWLGRVVQRGGGSRMKEPVGAQWDRVLSGRGDWP